MAEERLSISVIDPISPAIERVKAVLFQPFDFERWFAIGFCAWLAYLGGGGGGGNFNFGRHNPQSIGQMKDFIHHNLPFIIIFGAIGVVVAISIGLLMTWLSSRGRFMFLHCVAENKAEVKLPWSKYKNQADSLFLFRVVIGIIGLIVILLPCVFGSIFIYMMSGTSRLNMVPLLAAIMFFLMAALFIILFALIHKFTRDFVLPIMFLSGVKCTQAWRQFWLILSANKGRFAVYILFQIVIGMTISAMIFAAIMFTCCAACCFLMIPFISTVFLLPIFVFKRAYSLYYLGQFGSQFDVFSTPIASSDEIVTI